MNENIKVLIGSPIRQEYEILDNFINSLKYIIKEDILVDYFFIDDNDDINSKNLLYKFSQESNERVIIEQGESDKRYVNFIEQLKKPATYEVGGLGACTLISKKALDKGVNFNKIYNLHFWGEDRHFCIRAAALCLKLYVNITYPAYHIYRKEDIKGVEEL